MSVRPGMRHPGEYTQQRTSIVPGMSDYFVGNVHDVGRYIGAREPAHVRK